MKADPQSYPRIAVIVRLSGNKEETIPLFCFKSIKDYYEEVTGPNVAFPDDLRIGEYAIYFDTLH